MEQLRHVFVVNPAAGRSSCEELVRRSAEAVFAGEDTEYAVRVSRCAGDAGRIAREEAQSGRPVRLYACGGDGTLWEVVNGAAGFSGAEVAALPVGTGNDYVKTFGEIGDFLDPAKLVRGQAVTVDLIRVNGRYAANLCSAGFDAEVALNLTRFSRLPFVPGPLAYNLSVANGLLRKMKSDFSVTIDGQKEAAGQFLLVVAANGQWYGGGFRAAPAADPSDGLLDFVLAEPLGRIEFIKMVNKYREGRHETLRCIRHLTGRRLEIESEHEFALNCDGEVEHVRSASFEIVPAAMRFVLPLGLRKTGEPAISTNETAENLAKLAE